MPAPHVSPADGSADPPAKPRRALRPNVGTTVATYALLALAGSVSFVLPESIDAPITDALPQPATRTEAPASTRPASTMAHRHVP